MTDHLATRMRADINVIADSLDRKDARIAALEAAIEKFRLAKMQFEAGGHVTQLHRAEEEMFQVMRAQGSR
jgi:hypothetical protein